MTKSDVFHEVVTQIGAPPTLSCGRPTVWQRLIDSFPAAMVALWALTFAIGGTTLPIQGVSFWRAAAGVVAGVNIISALLPYTRGTRIIAGTVSVMATWVWGFYWLAAWLYGTELGDRISPFAITQNFMIIVFMAWSYGRKASHDPSCVK